MTQAGHPPSTVAVIADSDTRWKWGATLAHRLGASRVDGHLVLGRSCPTERQLADVGVAADSLRRESAAETVTRLAASSADVVVLACIGGTVQAFLHAFATAWADRPDRPVVVTGYVGLVYEKVVDGLLLRAGADVVLANSEADADRFREIYAEVGADAGSVVPTALPFLGGTPYDPAAAGRDRPFTVTFVTQPGVPETKAERAYAITRAAEHARRFPQRTVVVKLRGRRGERTTHVEPWHYESLLPAADRPPNLEFVYGAMAPVLDRTDICLTVSSTAALEAMHRGIPTGVLVDFGIRELLGNQLFVGSGAYTSWRQLNEGAVPTVDAVWAARHGVHVHGDHDQDDAYAAARDRVGRCLASTRPRLQPWLSAADAAGYLPDLLARHGLDPAGRPTGRAALSDEVPFTTRALRATARRAYTMGVRVLEPRIKRMAQL